jgi:transposase
MKRLELEHKTNILTQIRNYLERNSESKFIHRLQVVLLFGEREKETCESLGALFGNSPRSISNWIKKLNQTGVIESLRCNDKAGRPMRLTQSQKHELKMILQEKPEMHGEAGKRWKGMNLSRFISRRYGVDLSVRACQLLLREQVFRRRVSDPRDPSKDIDSVNDEKNRNIRNN